jgi:hypothetical protein
MELQTSSDRTRIQMAAPPCGPYGIETGYNPRKKRVLDRLIIIIPQKTLTFVEPRLPLQGIRHNALYKYFNEH